jgi:hypothetical protein
VAQVRVLAQGARERGQSLEVVSVPVVHAAPGGGVRGYPRAPRLEGPSPALSS